MPYFCCYKSGTQKWEKGWHLSSWHRLNMLSTSSKACTVIFFLLKNLFWFYLCVCVRVFIIHKCSACGDKRALGSLEVEDTGGCERLMSTGNRTPVHRKNSGFVSGFLFYSTDLRALHWCLTWNQDTVVSPSNTTLLLGIALETQGLLHFHMYLRILILFPWKISIRIPLKLHWV